MRKVVALALGTGALLALATGLRADNGPQHRVRQTRPISLGTSGGNINDITTFYCCSGTLGSLVKNSAGTQFILSNNHVMALSNNGHVGDRITQPGMIEVQCAQITSDTVANLSAWVTISKSRTANNVVDGAVAQVVAGTVSTIGNILDIGCLNGSRSASLNMAVKKSGRTTGYTTGTVAATSVTILVGYPNSCGSGATKTARFISQIQVSPGSFLGGGDSGSLMVENVNDSRQDAVGLLFAGGSSAAFANPISSVLSTMPGGPYTMVTCTGLVDPPAPSPEETDPRYADAVAAQSQLNEYLWQIRRDIKGVIGSGITRPEGGDYQIRVYVRSIQERHTRFVPTTISGFTVELFETGDVVAK